MVYADDADERAYCRGQRHHYQVTEIETNWEIMGSKTHDRISSVCTECGDKRLDWWSKTENTVIGQTFRD